MFIETQVNNPAGDFGTIQYTAQRYKESHNFKRVFTVQYNTVYAEVQLTGVAAVHYKCVVPSTTCRFDEDMDKRYYVHEF